MASHLKFRHTKLTPCNRVLLEKLICPQLATITLLFMEPEGSLACSQQPSPCRYPEAAKSSPSCPFHSAYLRNVLIWFSSSHLHHSLPSCQYSTYATAVGPLDLKALVGLSMLCSFLQLTESQIFMQFKVAILS